MYSKNQPTAFPYSRTLPPKNYYSGNPPQYSFFYQHQQQQCPPSYCSTPTSQNNEMVHTNVKMMYYTPSSLLPPFTSSQQHVSYMLPQFIFPTPMYVSPRGHIEHLGQHKNIKASTRRSSIDSINIQSTNSVDVNENNKNNHHVIENKDKHEKESSNLENPFNIPNKTILFSDSEKYDPNENIFEKDKLNGFAYFVFEHNENQDEERCFKKLSKKQIEKMERDIKKEEKKEKGFMVKGKFFWHYWSNVHNPRCTRRNSTYDKFIQGSSVGVKKKRGMKKHLS